MSQMQISVDENTGGLHFSASPENSILLHPLWVRERVDGPGDFDPVNNQRTYDPVYFSLDLKITQANYRDSKRLDLEFSDGYKSNIRLSKIERELGWKPNPEEPPIPQGWDAGLNIRPQANWADLEDPDTLKKMLGEFLTYGFCIMHDTPTNRDDIVKLAGRFGYVRDTHWGQVFNVEKKQVATDTAYTDLALPSHTDNPYRDPIPGIQFLHCLKNEVPGGLSTLADGIAIAKRLRIEAPEQADVLEQVKVRFRYQGPAAILENHGSMIERDHRGIVRTIRLSSKLDYVPAMEKSTMDLFYAGRKRLQELAISDEFQIRFPFKPGTLLMMDNYRLLHGRTAFDSQKGRRHLQGCYIDHDGIGSLYRMLARGDKNTSVMHENN